MKPTKKFYIYKYYLFIFVSLWVFTPLKGVADSGEDCSPERPAHDPALIKAAKEAKEAADQVGAPPQPSGELSIASDFAIQGKNTKINLKAKKNTETLKLKQLMALFKRRLDGKKNKNKMQDLQDLANLTAPIQTKPGDLHAGGSLTLAEDQGFHSTATSVFQYSPRMKNGKPESLEFSFKNWANPELSNQSSSLFDITLRLSGVLEGKIQGSVAIVNTRIFPAEAGKILADTHCELWEAKMAELLKGKSPPPGETHGVCTTLGGEDVFYAQKYMESGMGDSKSIGGLPFQFGAKGIGRQKRNLSTQGKMVKTFEPASLQLKYKDQVYSGTPPSGQVALDGSGAFSFKDLSFLGLSGSITLHEAKFNPNGKSSLHLEIREHPKSMADDPLIHYAFASLLNRERHEEKDRGRAMSSHERELLLKLKEIYTTQKNQELTNLDWITIRKLSTTALSELHHRYKAANDTQIALLKYLEKLKPIDQQLEKLLETNNGQAFIKTEPYHPTYETSRITVSIDGLEMAKGGMQIKDLYLLNRNAFTTDNFEAHGISQRDENGKPVTHFTQAKMRRFSAANRLRFGVASVLAEIIPGLRDVMGKEKAMNILTVEFNTRVHKGNPLNGVSLQGSLGDFLENLQGTFDGKDYNYRSFAKTLLQSDGRYEIRTRVADGEPPVHFTGNPFKTTDHVRQAFSEMQSYYNQADKNLTDAYIETKHDPKKGYSDVDLDHMRDGFLGVIVRGLYSSPKALIRSAASVALPAGAGFFLMDGEGLADGSKQFFDSKRKIEDAVKFETNKIKQKPILLALSSLPESETEEFAELTKCQSMDFRDKNCIINTRQTIASISMQQISNSPCVLGDSLQFRPGPPPSVFVKNGCQVEVKIRVRKKALATTPPTPPKALLQNAKVLEGQYVSAGRKSGTGSYSMNEGEQILRIQYKPANRDFNWCQEGRDYGFDNTAKPAKIWVKNHCHGYFDVTHANTKTTQKGKSTPARRRGRD